MSSYKIDLFDVSKKEREILEWKQARKLALREEYLKQVHHPTYQPVVIEDAVHRVNFLRLAREYNATYTGKTGRFVALFLVVMIYGVGGSSISGKKKLLEDYKTGKISYADRWNKFV